MLQGTLLWARSFCTTTVQNTGKEEGILKNLNFWILAVTTYINLIFTLSNCMSLSPLYDMSSSTFLSMSGSRAKGASSYCENVLKDSKYFSKKGRGGRVL
jgi:hypothetical protein